MHRIHGLLLIVVFAAMTSAAVAQSFNIDVGDQAVPYGLPSSSYGAAASQTGSWFAASPIPTTVEMLSDLTGAPTNVVIYHNGGAGAFDSNASASLTGNSEALLCDCQDTGGAGGFTTWTISNLLGGSYALYTYAWSPNDASSISAVSGGTIDPTQAVGGAWTGSHVQGVTYALHHFNVAPSGSITVAIATVNGSASVNGFQLVGLAIAPGIPNCFGDGSGSPCPCFNFGSAGSGCANSINPNGASLVASGHAGIAADTVILQGSGMPNSSALYFQGTGQVLSAFGDGILCVGGNVIRLGLKLNSSGASQYPTGVDLPVSVRGLDTAGDIRQYQVWYRNPAAFCTAATFNLSNAYTITWTL